MKTGNNRLKKQIQFIVEIDKLKNIVRQTLLTDQSRRETDAEHSWHVALMAVLLLEHAEDKTIDLARTVTMLLVHDLVEIDAGDTFCYDEEGNADKLERETRAADRIFDLLPEDQAAYFRALWDEFEAGKTAESRFAAALDRFQPILNNYATEGGTWKEHQIHKSQVLKRIRPIADGSETLWAYAADLLDDAVARGFLRATEDGGRKTTDRGQKTEDRAKNHLSQRAQSRREKA